MATNYLSINDYYNKKGDFDTARIFLDKQLHINTESNDEYGHGTTYEFYGHSYKKEEIDYKKAIFFMKTPST